MKCRGVVLLGMLSTSAAACGGKILNETDGGSAGASGPTPYAAECAGAATPATTLECTGLYADLATKEIAPGVHPYAPAVPLWADGAEKERWIQLPAGTKIDATDPNEWKFPVGTKVWKEFKRDGKRVETRLWQKVRSNYWVRATYRWTPDESAATSSAGVDIPWGTDGGIYHIPSGDECDQCHRGRTDHILGFEQVSLGLSGATGLTLPQLVTEGLIAPAPTHTQLTIGDDGTGAAAAPLAWLHVNCGVSCHNGNSDSTGYGASQRLRLDPALLDGQSSAGFDSITTTVGRTADTPTWAGQTRIIPGDPADSLLVKLISNRGTMNPVSNQMPPIASFVVDQPDVQTVVAWIARMPRGPVAVIDAGAGAPPDAGIDAVGTAPAASSDAGIDDATVTTPDSDATVTTDATSSSAVDAIADSPVDDAAMESGDELDGGLE